MLSIRKHFQSRAIVILSLAIIFSLVSCIEQPAKQDGLSFISDPLPSWNDGKVKQEIIDFVKNTTDKDNPDFIPINERIAVFDNDGTLWSEQPAYFQFFYIMDKVKQMAPAHPEWKSKEPYKSALAGDMEGVIHSDMQALLTLTLASPSGMTSVEYEKSAREWIDTTRHPVTGRLLKEMVYQPMLEVLDYLRANGFKTYIVSGGGIDFMRAWTEEVYGIPPEQVVGSSLKSIFEMSDGQPVIMKMPEMEYFNDKENKPLAINKFIGRRPVAAFGNSDGDLAMLQWTAVGEGSRLMVYIHHTDSIREYSYDRESHIGRLDKGLDEAYEKGWVVVDMEDDWKEIFPGK